MKKETTKVKVVIDNKFHNTDRTLLLSLMPSLAVDSDELNQTEKSFTGEVYLDTFSALCILEDAGILSVEQIGD